MTLNAACVIPALDAGATLEFVASGLRAALPLALLVAVDDGSRDDTRAAAERSCDVTLSFLRNRGKGAALRAGARAALRLGASAVITVDADGQHDPAFAPSLLRALDDSDVALGTRSRARSTMPLHRRLTNVAASVAVRACTGRGVNDPQCGFRAVRADVWRGVTAHGDRYEYETEFLVLAIRAGYRVAEVPIPTRYGARSHFTARDGARVVRTLWRHRRAN